MLLVILAWYKGASRTGDGVTKQGWKVQRCDGWKPKRSSKTGEQNLTYVLLMPHSASGGFLQVEGHCTVREHSPSMYSFFFLFSFSPMASLKARSLWRGNVLFSWGRYFVCSLEATLPLESSQKNTAARSPLPPSLSFAVPPCPPPPTLHPSTLSPQPPPPHHLCLLFLLLSTSHSTAQTSPAPQPE